jgi:hypothetical protein
VPLSLSLSIVKAFNCVPQLNSTFLNSELLFYCEPKDAQKSSTFIPESHLLLSHLKIIVNQLIANSADMKKLIIDNLETLLQTLKEQANDKNKSIFLLFTGSKDSSGKSWCPDCNIADPIIEQVINEQTYDSDDYLFITVFVGERDV